MKLAESKVCRCGVIFHRKSEPNQVWARKKSCSENCGQKTKRAQLTLPPKPACFSDAQWELWKQEQGVSGLMHVTDFRDPCDPRQCLPDFKAKMRIAGKCGLFNEFLGRAEKYHKKMAEIIARV